MIWLIAAHRRRVLLWLVIPSVESGHVRPQRRELLFGKSENQLALLKESDGGSLPALLARHGERHRYREITGIALEPVLDVEFSEVLEIGGDGEFADL